MTLDPEHVQQGIDWIERQRDHYASLGDAEALPAELRARFAPYFLPEILSKVRIVNRPLPPPPVIGGIPFDFTNSLALTLDHVIVHVPSTPDHPGMTLLLLQSIIFHELVHMTQYARYGLRGFVERYLQGRLDGGDWHTVPLELVAYTLQARFLINQSDYFDVAEYVDRMQGLRVSSSG